jgi:hypothetical protein
MLMEFDDGHNDITVGSANHQRIWKLIESFRGRTRQTLYFLSGLPCKANSHRNRSESALCAAKEGQRENKPSFDFSPALQKTPKHQLSYALTDEQLATELPTPERKTGERESLEEKEIQPGTECRVVTRTGQTKKHAGNIYHCVKILFLQEKP